MTGEDRGVRRSRTVVDVLACLGGFGLVALWTFTATDSFLIAGSFAVVVGTSTTVVTVGIVQFTGRRVASSTRPPGRRIAAYFTGSALETDSEVEGDTGWLIGRLENVIVLTFVLAGEFTALSIVFAAKSFVRREDISSEDTAYYLAGTLLNFTYSILVGIAVLWLIDGPVVL